jgi:competence protein ComEC
MTADAPQERLRLAPAPVALAFAVGCGGFLLLPRMPDAWLVWSLLAAAAASALLATRCCGPRLRAVLVAGGIAASGALWAYLDACRVLCTPFPERLINTTLVAEGRIAALPEDRGYAERFLFRIDRLQREGQALAFRGLVRLSWYDERPPLRAGERWRLALRLKPPHGFVNPGGFDYEGWLFQRGIKATGHVRDAEAAVRLDAGPGRHWLARGRQWLRDQLAALLPAGPAAALVPALVLGDRGGLTPSQWEVFSRTGTSHLIAISGLHVGLVAGVVFVGTRWLWAWTPGLARRLAAPRAAAGVALLAAAGYAALAGFSISTQRALAMLAVVLVATMLGRTLRPLSGLALALLAVLLLDPTSVLAYGFWLSFGAVAALLYALGQRLAPTFAVLRWGRAQWAVAVGLLPLLLLFFGRASLVAPAVNLVLVPLFGLVLPAVLLSATVALVGGWDWALWPVAALLNAGYALLDWIAGWDLAGMALGGRAAWVWLAAGVGVLLLLAPRGVPARSLGLVLCLPLAAARPPAPAVGEAELTMLDVGQGLAAVVRTAQHTLVYDLGVGWPSGFNTGAVVVAPYLRHQGVDAVDTLIVSHADQDHAGGLSGLLADLPVTRLLSGEPSALNTPDGINSEPCRAGTQWRWDGVTFRILHPTGRGESGNNASCVLHVATGGASVLLTGDVEAGVEAELVAAFGERLRADVLLASHHGSDSSSTMPFLRAVDPRWVWFSAGYGNRWGFPHEAVVARVRALGVATASTATDGAVSLRLPAEPAPLVPMRARQAQQRLWRHRPGLRPP